ncbi:MAG: phenylalanine--tRNA ligase subunit alpha [Candidatus Omnitrophica bacterium]|nr:phenylalanine--tRNA ligase subunit alpha [Candidatus Omnitrophota bacterium]
MIEDLKKLEVETQNDLESVTDKKTLEALKIKILGRKGLFASLAGRMGEVPAPDKPAAGQELNRVKRILEESFKEKEASFSAVSPETKSLDATMPGTFALPGGIHPLTQVTLDVTRIFERLGFAVVDGPEVETEYTNFEALNIPLDHPSRDSFDTFYLDNGKLLRSQTSTVQIRVMEKRKPPLKIIAPGKVYRPDATDATHSFMFHQIEGLMVDEGARFSDLKGILLAFANEFFGAGTKLRFRPHFFPFTEPSAEIDLWSPTRGWLEILGAGMVHPNVLRGVKIDPEKFTGFAFGMGVERVAMLKYGVEDIRMFFENDIRFLKQF